MTPPIVMQVEEQDAHQYRVRYDAWQYRAPRDDGSDKIFLANLPLSWIDIIPFMVARKLLDEARYQINDYNLDRVLVIKLQGSDHELMHAPLGVVAATPLLNTDKPVTQTPDSYYGEFARM